MIDRTTLSKLVMSSNFLYAFKKYHKQVVSEGFLPTVAGKTIGSSQNYKQLSEKLIYLCLCGKSFSEIPPDLISIIKNDTNIEKNLQYVLDVLYDGFLVSEKENKSFYINRFVDVLPENVRNWFLSKTFDMVHKLNLQLGSFPVRVNVGFTDTFADFVLTCSNEVFNCLITYTDFETTRMKWWERKFPIQQYISWKDLSTEKRTILLEQIKNSYQNDIKNLPPVEQFLGLFFDPDFPVNAMMELIDLVIKNKPVHVIPTVFTRIDVTKLIEIHEKNKIQPVILKIATIADTTTIIECLQAMSKENFYQWFKQTKSPSKRRLALHYPNFFQEINDKIVLQVLREYCKVKETLGLYPPVFLPEKYIEKLSAEQTINLLLKTTSEDGFKDFQYTYHVVEKKLLPVLIALSDTERKKVQKHLELLKILQESNQMKKLLNIGEQLTGCDYFKLFTSASIITILEKLTRQIIYSNLSDRYKEALLLFLYDYLLKKKPQPTTLYSKHKHVLDIPNLSSLIKQQ